MVQYFWEVQVLKKSQELPTLLLLQWCNLESLYKNKLCKIFYCCIYQDNIVLPFWGQQNLEHLIRVQVQALKKSQELPTLLRLQLCNLESLYQTKLCKIFHCCIYQDNIVLPFWGQQSLEPLLLVQVQALKKSQELPTLLRLQLCNLESLYQTKLFKIFHCCICQDNIVLPFWGQQNLEHL